MKFFVNDIAATPNSGGVYSILSDFYQEVVANDKKNEWIFLLSGKYFSETKNVKIIVREDLKRSKIKKLFFELFTGARYINNFSPDVFISLQNISTIGVAAKRKIVYLHQPIPFQKLVSFKFYKKNERKLFFYQKLVGRIIKYSIGHEKPFVVVQTRWMKKALLNQVKIPNSKIYIAHPKVDIPTSKLSVSGNSFFYPASSFIYKNHRVIFDAVTILENEGIKDFNVKLTINKNQLPFRNSNVYFVGHLKRNEVFKLYSTNVLLFPSYIESFGLPLIEAALRGDIILVAETEFSKELLSSYKNVYFFEYNKPQELALLMKQVIEGNIKPDGSCLTTENNGESLLHSVQTIIKMREYENG